VRIRETLKRWQITDSVPLPILAIIFLEQASFIALFFFFTQRYLPQDRALGVAFAGYVITTFFLTKLLFQTPSGWLGDRIGYRTTLVVGLSLSLAATFLMMLTHQPIVLLAATALYALGKAPVSPALNATLANLYQEDRRGQIVALTNAAGLAAVALAGLSGFVLIDFVPAVVLFLVSSFLTAATLVVALRWVPETSFEVTVRHRWRLRGIPFRELTSPHVVTWGGILLLIGVAMGLLGPVSRAYSKDVLGMDMYELVPYLILPIMVAAVCIIPCGHLADKAGRLPPLVIGLGIGAVGLLGISITASVWAIMGLTTFILLSYTLTSPAAGAAMMDLTRENTRGFVLGALGTVQGVGGAIGPSIGGRLYEALEPQAVFYVAGALLAGAMMLAAAYALRRQLAMAFVIIRG